MLQKKEKKANPSFEANIKDKHCGKNNVNSFHVLFLFLIGCSAHGLSFSSHPWQTRPSALSKSLTPPSPPSPTPLIFTRSFLCSDIPFGEETAATNRQCHLSCPTKLN